MRVAKALYCLHQSFGTTTGGGAVGTTGCEENVAGSCSAATMSSYRETTHRFICSFQTKPGVSRRAPKSSQTFAESLKGQLRIARLSTAEPVQSENYHIGTIARVLTMRFTHARLELPWPLWTAPGSHAFRAEPLALRKEAHMMAKSSLSSSQFPSLAASGEEPSPK